MEGIFGFLKQFVLLMVLRHTMHSNPRVSVQESIGKSYSCWSLMVFLLLQVSWEFVSGTSSHTYYIWVRNHMPYHHSVSYTEKHITHSLPLALLLVLHTHNNTDATNLWYFPVLLCAITDWAINLEAHTHKPQASDKYEKWNATAVVEVLNQR